MPRSLVPLSAKEHGRMRFSPTGNFSFAKQRRSCPVTLGEIERAALAFPIVFPELTTPEAQVVPQVVFSLNEEIANPWVNDEDQWTASFLPLHLQKHPFYLGKENTEDTQSVLMIDPNASQLNSSKGKLLYNKKGNTLTPSPMLKQIKQELSALDAQTLLTAKLCAELKPCLVSGKLSAQQGKKQQDVRGFSIVSWSKVSDQDDATLARWARSGLLQLVQLHLLSLKRAGIKIN